MERVAAGFGPADVRVRVLVDQIFQKRTQAERLLQRFSRRSARGGNPAGGGVFVPRNLWKGDLDDRRGRRARRGAYRRSRRTLPRA